MKLSFSTRGWPSFSFEEMLSTATDMGFSGIEVYNLPNFPSLTDRGGPFHKYNVAATARQLRENKLSIPSFDTSYDISSKETSTEAIISLIDIAESGRVPYVALCALTENEDRVVKTVGELLPIALRYRNKYRWF